MTTILGMLGRQCHYIAERGGSDNFRDEDEKCKGPRLLPTVCPFDEEIRETIRMCNCCDNCRRECQLCI